MKFQFSWFSKISNFLVLFRLLEQSNDVEKNPGPPKVVKNGLITNKMNPTNNKKEDITVNGNGFAEINNFEDLKVLLEKQNETIKSQKTEIESLRKQLEKNMNLTQDFQSELSEIRKNWQSISDSNSKPIPTSISSTITNSSMPKDKSLDDISLRLEALSSAYTDIQVSHSVEML